MSTETQSMSLYDKVVVNNTLNTFGSFTLVGHLFN